MAQKYAEAKGDVKGYQSTQTALEKSFAERRNELDTHFKGLASEVLRSSTEELRKQAAEQFKAGETAVENLIKPVRKTLDELHKHVDEYDRARIADTSKISQSVDRLMAETSRTIP